jgi:hypothetical protein
MNSRHTHRFASAALAALMTWTIVSGIDTLAVTERSDAAQMSHAATATQVASARAPAPRT